MNMLVLYVFAAVSVYWGRCVYTFDGRLYIDVYIQYTPSISLFSHGAVGVGGSLQSHLFAIHTPATRRRKGSDKMRRGATPPRTSTLRTNEANSR